MGNNVSTPQQTNNNEQMKSSISLPIQSIVKVDNECPVETAKCPVQGTVPSKWAKYCPMKSVNSPNSIPKSTTECKDCPIPKTTTNNVNSDACPVKQSKNINSSSDGCPMKQKDGKYKNPNVYNVISQKIDPTNNMPSQANNLPSPNQTIAISTERVPSNIPKGGTDDGTWIYPSPQMFWNALVRKNKTEGANEEDMENVIAVHNNMNENTWSQVMAWEELHPVTEEGREPKLLRFLGKPDDLSPKARLKMVFGHNAPFDRHDWVVDRGGEEVRYVIDYYHDESSIQKDQKPTHLKDMTSMQSIKVDVRPAIDSVGSVIDRIFRMPLAESGIATHIYKPTSYNPPPFFPTNQMKEAEDNKLKRIKQNWVDIKLNCEDAKNKLKNCTNDDDCGQASVALQICTAKVVCPSIANEFDKCVNAKPPNMGKTSTAYSGVIKCLDIFAMDSKNPEK